MWPESSESPKPLRSGLTTGSCATACCVAATQALFAQRQPESVEITLPKGQQVNLPISGYHWLDTNELQSPEAASEIAAEETVEVKRAVPRATKREPIRRRASGIRTATVKDAGDDPDVTHGATVYVELRLTEQPGIEFKAANGVGTVTREGLALAVGEPAINPVPRKMITEHLTQAAYTWQYEGGFEVSVGVEKGEQIALKTMNPRLGILGGLSILGTTGIVRPYSCSAYIASIHQAISVAKHNGHHHIAATTGSSSEKAVADLYGLPEMALVEMGDFVGAVLKYLKKVPMQKLTLCGGFGKFSKLSEGHLDLNSRASAISFEHLVEQARLAGADQALCEQILHCNTSIQALKLCQSAGVPFGDQICKTAWQKARKYLPEGTELEVLAIDRQGNFVGGYPARIEQIA